MLDADDHSGRSVGISDSSDPSEEDNGAGEDLAGRVSAMAKTNQREQDCHECGDIVPSGEGNLWWEAGPDDGGDVVGRTPAGWRVTHRDESICARAREDRRVARAEARAEAQRRKVAAREAEAAALAEQHREIERLLAAHGCNTAAGYSWSGAVLAPGDGTPVSQVRLARSMSPALSGLSLGHSDWTLHTTTDGRVCFVHHFGNASVLHAPRDVVERAWSLLVDSELRAYYQPEVCRHWLIECEIEARSAVPPADRKSVFDQLTAGWEARAYLAGREDLLRAEGVLI